MHSPISLIIFIAIVILIAMRQWLPKAIGIWVIMLLGAIMMILTKQISLLNAFYLIQWNIIGFLFGLFSIGSALNYSGLLSIICKHCFSSIKSPPKLLFVFMFVSALASAIFTNDTIAVILTPIALLLAKQTKSSSKLYLLALCFSLTIGSALTPIGNPQNLLIASQSNLSNPFSYFLIYAAPPVILSFILAYCWLYFLFRHHLTQTLSKVAFPIQNSSTAKWPSMLSIMLFILLLIYFSLSHFIEFFPKIPLAITSLIAAVPVYIFYHERFKLLKQIDWHTLIFFIAMFIVIGSLWESHVIQHLITIYQIDPTSFSHIFIISSILSQIISNVPLVELYLSYLQQYTACSLMALSLSSTLAGNLFIISAASTIIVIQKAEKQNNYSITFWNFLLAGLPITFISLLISYLWLTLLHC
ncbi:MAG: arsenic resistance protein [Gammaproteobacteria bacterium]|nr:MAG: arsenic resistance protein [Gammaproteobacteria bacterium]UTW43420.1 arsenic resistance protein [bacterium SCSIO 12844]